MNFKTYIKHSLIKNLLRHIGQDTRIPNYWQAARSPDLILWILLFTSIESLAMHIFGDLGRKNILNSQNNAHRLEDFGDLR